MVGVEHQKALARGVEEFLPRNAAIEVHVGRDHRLGDVEEGETAGALQARFELASILAFALASIPAAAFAATALTHAAAAPAHSPASAAPAAAAASAAHPAVAAHLHPDLDFGRDVVLVMGDFVGIELAVVIGVERREESRRVGA